MPRPLAALLAVLTLTAACETTGGSTGPMADPNPQAPLVESITEPTDGAENEIGVN